MHSPTPPNALPSTSGYLETASRFAAPILGGYVFTYGFVALATLASFGAGLRFFEAQDVAWMTSLLVYLGALMWGFTPRRTGLVWLVLGGGGVTMGVAAWALSRMMLA